MKKIGIIDGNYGNIRSVFHAFEYLGTNPKIVVNPEDAKEFDALILPGVGTFENCMNSLRNTRWDNALQECAAKGKHLLGICVGMQVLMDKGFEFGEHNGLGLIKGECHSLTAYRDDARDIPHIGWAEVTFRNKSLDNDFFYFNHSYVCVPEDSTCIKATACHSKKWPAYIRAGNISGIQCHPEKSHRAGLKFLQKFLDDIS